MGRSRSRSRSLDQDQSYGETGRLTTLGFPSGSNLRRAQGCQPWREPGNGGMLESLKVGLSEGKDERLSRGYAYNGFGDITSLTEGTTSNSFTSGARSSWCQAQLASEQSPNPRSTRLPAA